MSDDPKSESQERPRVLAVSQDPGTLEQIQWALEGVTDLCIQEDSVAAWSMVCAEPLSGVIIDGSLPSEMASLLTGAFLRHQEGGRVGVITSTDEPSSLMGIAIREDRVELLYRPLDLEMLRETILCPDEDPVFDFVLD